MTVPTSPTVTRAHKGPDPPVLGPPMDDPGRALEGEIVEGSRSRGKEIGGRTTSVCGPADRRGCKGGYEGTANAVVCLLLENDYQRWRLAGVDWPRIEMDPLVDPAQPAAPVMAERKGLLIGSVWPLKAIRSGALRAKPHRLQHELHRRRQAGQHGASGSAGAPHR